MTPTVPKLLAVLILPLAACTEATPPDRPEPAKIGMANPAAVYCVEQGGTVVPGDNPGDDALCHLPDGRKVGEWLYYNEHHRPETPPDAA